MTEHRQVALFALLTLIAATSFGALIVGFKTLDQYRTDNQTLSILRAQVSELKQDLHDTEVALDKEALQRNRLELENEVLKARAETAERKMRL